MKDIMRALTLITFLFSLPMLTLDQAYAKNPNAIDVPGGAFNNNEDAKKLCPAACLKVGRNWNGNWGPATVLCYGNKTCPCSCDPVKQDIPAGLIANDDEAKSKCPSVCSTFALQWGGTWTTTVPGKMSTCSCQTKM
jgi:hypothetical protein